MATGLKIKANEAKFKLSRSETELFKFFLNFLHQNYIVAFLDALRVLPILSSFLFIVFSAGCGISAKRFNIGGVDGRSRSNSKSQCSNE